MSQPLADTLPIAVVDTTLAHLAPLFLIGAAGDITAARHAAAQTLAAYDPRTEDEFRLAANIVSFSFQALEALGQAANPDIPPTRTLRLRSGAVSLSRESHKAQRRLDQVQKARRAGVPIQPTEQPKAGQPEAKIEKAAGLIQDTRKVAVAAKTQGLTWSQAYEQRQRDRRLAANQKRAAARSGAQPSATPNTVPAIALQASRSIQAAAQTL